MRRFLFFLFILLLTKAPSQSTVSAISYAKSGFVYSQSFDGLPNSGSFTLTGKGPFNLTDPPINSGGLSGWQMYMYGGTNSNAAFAFGTGSNNNNGIYSFGSSSSTDRALGSISTNSSAVYAFGAVFQNNTGAALNAFTISYTAEEWRNGGSNTACTWSFKYLIGSSITNINQSGLSINSNLNFSSPVTSASISSGNGNSSSYQKNVSYTITGITWNNGDYLLIRFDDANGTNRDGIGIDNFSFAAYPSTNFYSWSGGTSGSYNVSTNWTPNRTSSSNSDILLFNVSSATQVDNLSTETIGHLIVSGTASVTLLNSSASNTLSINKSVNIGNNASLSISTNASLNISSTASVTTSGTLNTNNSLILSADNNSTASINLTTGSINGNITAQCYLSGKRAFRFLAHPFSNSTGLNALTDNIDITGSGGNSNGFTSTSTNNTSAFWYNTANGNSSQSPDPGWTSFTNTNGSGNNAWNQYQGIRILARGAKSQGLDGNSYIPSATVIDMSGTVNTGNQTITLTKGSNSNYNLIGNPYAAPIDLSLTTRASNVGANFYVWDIAQGIRGGYTSNPFSTPYILPPYAAFFAQTSNSSTNNTIQFTETCKSTTASTATLLGNNKFNGYHLSLEIISDNIFWDRLLFLFNDSTSSNVDLIDANKLFNPDLSFYSFSDDSIPLSIDARPFSFKKNIILGIRSNTNGNFSIKVNDIHLPLNASLQLHDKLLDTYQILNQNSVYHFNITNDPASQGNNRFELTSYKNTVVTIDPTAVVNFSVAPNPFVDKIIIDNPFTSPQKTFIKLISINGKIIQSINVTHQQQTVIQTSQLSKGIYLIELQNGEKKLVQKIIKL